MNFESILEYIFEGIGIIVVTLIIIALTLLIENKLSNWKRNRDILKEKSMKKVRQYKELKNIEKKLGYIEIELPHNINEKYADLCRLIRNEIRIMEDELYEE